ncbi:MAG: protein-L-isoaspartate O-methyltransferase [Pseudomonadota bacterium]
MVESQLRPNNVTEPRLIDTMGRIPREKFVPASRRAIAYCDESVELMPPDADGNGPRYLMEPMTFGRLVQLSGVRRTDLVLDVGCATGYSAAVLGHLADAVVAVEEIAPMAEEASNLLTELGVDNAAVLTGRLNEGHAKQGPYDVIILQGSVQQVPERLFDQLKDGGRLAVVVEEDGVGQARLYQKSGDTVSERPGFGANAKPLPGFEATREEFVF